MISLFLALALAPAPTSPARASAAANISLVPPGQDPDRDKEYERRKKEAGKDPEALWELYLWCDAYGMSKEARACLHGILRADPNHRKAHELLGHVFYDGQWFASEKLLDKYKKEEEERIAKEKGLVRFQDRWVPPEDVPFLERGMVRDDDGHWVSVEELEKLKAGWRRQDLQWIPPDEVPNLEKHLWKCGDRWLAESEANTYHAELDRWWVIPSEHYVLYTTVDRAVAQRATEAMEYAYRDLVRIFGKQPKSPVPVVVLRETSQYGRFAAGVEGGQPPTELRGLSSIHHAFFADGWFDPQTHRFMGAGVALWNSATEDADRFGVHAARHAAAQSYVEAIDPSPKAVAKAERGSGFTEGDVGDFWGEKRLPEWLRWGAAAYAERYFVDPFVKTGGDPYWARKWSVGNIKSRGGLRPLGQVFDDRLSIDDREGSERLINERGLVIAFVMDGGCKPVADAHAAVVEALLADKDPARPIEKLRKEIEKHEAELKAFAEL